MLLKIFSKVAPFFKNKLFAQNVSFFGFYSRFEQVLREIGNYLNYVRLYSLLWCYESFLVLVRVLCCDQCAAMSMRHRYCCPTAIFFQLLVKRVACCIQSNTKSQRVSLTKYLACLPPYVHCLPFIFDKSAAAISLTRQRSDHIFKNLL